MTQRVRTMSNGPARRVMLAAMLALSLGALAVQAPKAHAGVAVDIDVAPPEPRVIVAPPPRAASVPAQPPVATNPAVQP